jgi:hypothetical protein
MNTTISARQLHIYARVLLGVSDFDPCLSKSRILSWDCTATPLAIWHQRLITQVR